MTLYIVLFHDTGSRPRAGQGQVILTRDIVVVLGKLLERLSLRLLDEQRRKDAQEHEQGVNLQDMVEPGIGVVCGGAARAEGRNCSLACCELDLVI